MVKAGKVDFIVLLSLLNGTCECQLRDIRDFCFVDRSVFGT